MDRPKTCPRSRFIELATLTLTLLLVAPSAHATGPAVRSGDLVGELVSPLAEAHVVHEDLRIDMRPLAADAPAHIIARYTLRNDGPARLAEFFFAAREIRKARARHGGLTLSTRAARRALPGRWESTGAVAQPNAELVQGIAFDVLLAPGIQTVELDYLAKPDIYALDIVETAAIDYVASPAGQWASFGSLSLHLLLPAGWHMLDLPVALKASGDAEYRGTLHGFWSGAIAHHRDPAEHHRDGSDPASGIIRQHASPRRQPYLVLVAAERLLCVLALTVPVLAALNLRRRARATGSRVPLLRRVSSLFVCSVAVASLPLLPLLVERHWHMHRGAHHDQVFAIFGTWVVGGLSCLLSHTLAGWKPRRTIDRLPYS